MSLAPFFLQYTRFLQAKAIKRVIRMLKTDVNKENETVVRDEASRSHTLIKNPVGSKWHNILCQRPRGLRLQTRGHNGLNYNLDSNASHSTMEDRQHTPFWSSNTEYHVLTQTVRKHCLTYSNTAAVDVTSETIPLSSLRFNLIHQGH